MTIQFVDPPKLPQVEVYRQVSVATGTKLVFVAGQVAVDEHGEVVGDDLATQLAQCYANASTALAEVGATFDDVAKLTIYAVDWRADQMPQLVEGMARASERLGTTPVPPGTLIGVSALAAPEYLVELEVTAVVD